MWRCLGSLRSINQTLVKQVKQVKQGQVVVVFGLIKVYMCPILLYYVSSCYYVCAYICVLILYMCPTLLDVSSCYYVYAYICVLILYMRLYMCLHTIYVSSCCYVCAYICVLILHMCLYMCPHTIYVSSYNALGSLRSLSRCLFFFLFFGDLLSYTWLLQAKYVSSDLLSYSSMRALGI